MSDPTRTITDLPPSRAIAHLPGVPRRNGELVFEAPWESRAFGMVVALNQAGVYEWERFRTRLVDEIADREKDEYYASWLGAFERLLFDDGVLTPDEVGRRSAEYESLERTEVF